MANNKMDFGARMKQTAAGHDAEEKSRKIMQQELVNAQVVEESSTKKIGRPNKKQNISKKHSILLYMNEETQQKLQMIKVLNKVDMKDVAFAAMTRFLNEFYRDGKLTEQAMDYINSCVYED